MLLKYIFVLAILSVAGFGTLLIKRALLLRPGFGKPKPRLTFIMVVGLIVLALFMLSCTKKVEDNNAPIEAATEKEPVVTAQKEEKEINIDKQTDASGIVTATVTISVKDGNELKTEDKVFKGTQAEVDAKIKALKEKE